MKQNSSDIIAKIIVIILIALFIGLSLYSTFNGKKANGPAGMPGMSGMPDMSGMPKMTGDQGKSANINTITVSIKKIEPELIQSTVKVNGDVSSKTEVNTYPNTSGKISRLVKRTGDKVNKDEIIAYVDPSRPGTAYAESPIKSPITGTIISSNINAGDTVNTNTVIATVGSLSDLEITINVSEKYSNYLKLGLPAYLTLASAPDVKFNSTITKISPVVNKSNRTLTVTLELNKYDSRIKPGMFASVNLVIQERKNTIVVPKSAIKSYNEDNSLFIINKDNCAERVIVTTGISNDLNIEITSGIEVGQTVIIAGSVTEGSPVKIAGQKVDATATRGEK